MNTIRSWTQKQTKSAKPAGKGYVLKVSLKGAPVMDAALEKSIRDAAREPRKGKRYPIIAEAPDLY
ncbi:hypothetical protein JH302_17140 [Xanthomonas campestris]|uniref:hypothetical protein n=1 Tax=Xanthomonas campestris TaxID=339 RepID=UPI002377E65D|nr:hypothetical protein [Xanthomonas campestris]WDJ88926.1 hypothetical protein JH302_17140 [Xanthomonas campestris]WIX24887.1 hypothetical protein PUV44_20390 [Xanthomonas arboricola pv. corylina]